MRDLRKSLGAGLVQCWFYCFFNLPLCQNVPETCNLSTVFVLSKENRKPVACMGSFEIL